MKKIAFAIATVLFAGHAAGMPPPDGKKSGLEVDEPSSKDKLPPASSTGALEVPKATAGEDDVEGRLLPPRRRSIRGRREPRIWSIGARAGSLGNTGILGQYVGSGEYAWNVGLNFLDYTGLQALGLTVDQLAVFDDGFNRVTWPTLFKWQESRGKILYLAGLGFQMDAQGLYPRIPAGVQYTMVGDPVTWSFQATLFVGQILGTKPGTAIGMAPELGVRYVIE